MWGYCLLSHRFPLHFLISFRHTNRFFHTFQSIFHPTNWFSSKTEINLAQIFSNARRQLIKPVKIPLELLLHLIDCFYFPFMALFVFIFIHYSRNKWSFFIFYENGTLLFEKRKSWQRHSLPLLSFKFPSFFRFFWITRIFQNSRVFILVSTIECFLYSRDF